MGSITAVAAHCRKHGRKLRILWLDAHTDFNTSDITPSGNVHGMPVACLFGIGPDVLTSLGGHVPEIEPAPVRQTGKHGRAHVCTPVTNAPIVCRHMFYKKKT